MEGAVCIKEKRLAKLSEPNLIDCCTHCINVKGAFDYTKDNGINVDADYPPFPNDGTCKFDGSKRAITIEGYREVTKGDEEDLTDKLAEKGPISVFIDAARLSFQLYSSGVYYDPNCSSIQLNHFMLAVGYGAEDVSEYYIVKNSWGTSWGDNGYIKMSRNRNNNCGIATDASWPVA
jgi:cathepsin L